MKLNKKIVKEIILFGAVGLITLIIDVTITTILYDKFHSGAFIASAIGFSCGFLFNFPANRKKVFRNNGSHHRLSVQILLYGILCVFNLFATSEITSSLVSTGLLITIAKIFATACSSIWNFLIYKLLIFKEKQFNPGEQG